MRVRSLPHSRWNHTYIGSKLSMNLHMQTAEAVVVRCLVDIPCAAGGGFMYLLSKEESRNKLNPKSMFNDYTARSAASLALTFSPLFTINGSLYGGRFRIGSN